MNEVYDGLEIRLSGASLDNLESGRKLPAGSNPIFMAILLRPSRADSLMRMRPTKSPGG